MKELLGLSPSVLSLTIDDEGEVIGHIIFTTCHIEGVHTPVALLGPLCVLPDKQKQGLGSTLIRAGFARLRQQGTAHLYVLGDPAFYHRLGFVEEHGVLPPYPLPKDWQSAWQSATLKAESCSPQGTLSVPQPWRQSALWLP